MSCRVWRAFLLSWVTLAAACPQIANATPRRIVSINLCADQLLLALASRDQIAGVSPLAADPDNSYLGSRAKTIPSVRGNAESLLRLNADLVLLGSYDRPHALAMLERRNIAFLVIKPWTSLDQGRAQINRVAATLGRAENARTLQAAIDAEAGKLAALAKSSEGRASVLILQRRGFVDRHSLVAQLIQMAGLRFPDTDRPAFGGGTASLEEIIRWRPDFLVVDTLNDRPSDRGEAKLIHPALLRLYPPERRLLVPAKLSVCGGPSTPALIAALRREVETKVQRSGTSGR